MLFWWENAQNLGIYIVLVCDGNVAYVYRGRGNHRNTADRGSIVVVLFIVFVQIEVQLKSWAGADFGSLHRVKKEPSQK